MKRLSLFVLICLAAWRTLDAQAFEGLIVYQEDIKFDFSKTNGQAAPDQQAKQFQAMLGDGVKWGSHLRIQGGKTLYLPDPAETVAAPPPGQGDFAAMMRNNMKSKDEVYRDTETEELVEYTDFMGKKFLVTGPPPIKWKMTRSCLRCRRCLRERLSSFRSTKRSDTMTTKQRRGIRSASV